MSTHINVRIPEETKKNLEIISKITGRSISEIVRDIIIPMTSIKETIETIETIEKAEKALVRSIVLSDKFQELLKKLTEFLETKYLPCGFNGERVEEYKVLEYKYTIMYKNGKYYPAKVEIFEDCNSSMTMCWNTRYDYVEIETIKELSEFLEEARATVDYSLQTKVDEIKKYIAKILS